MPNCYYYDEQGNRCNCYVNKNLNELLAENARLREELEAAKHDLQVFSMGSVQLDAENDKLREYVTKLEQDNHRLDSDNCDLRNDMRDMQFIIDESHKLRELVRDMVDYGEGAGIGMAEFFADRMRKLGIKVAE